MAPVLAYLSDHKAETLTRVVRAVDDFVTRHSNGDTQFMLPAGNAGREAVTNIVVKRSEPLMLALDRLQRLSESRARVARGVRFRPLAPIREPRISRREGHVSRQPRTTRRLALARRYAPREPCRSSPCPNAGLSAYARHCRIDMVEAQRLDERGAPWIVSMR